MRARHAYITTILHQQRACTFHIRIPCQRIGPPSTWRFWFCQSKGHFTHETESPWPVHFNHSHWWKKRSRSNFASHYAWGTNGVYWWMQDGGRVYMDSYLASDKSCYMVTWTILKNHLLEVGLTQNRETMALRTFTTVDLFYIIMIENPHE
jgi:hypothetical protein